MPPDFTCHSLESSWLLPKNFTNFPERSMNAAEFSSSARVAKILYGRDADIAPILYVCSSCVLSFFTHFTVTAPLAVKSTRSRAFVVPVSKISRPSATSAAFAAMVFAQSMVSSEGRFVQKSPTFASGFCSESVRPTVHAASVQETCVSLVEVAVT